MVEEVRHVGEGPEHREESGLSIICSPELLRAAVKLHPEKEQGDDRWNGNLWQGDPSDACASQSLWRSSCLEARNSQLVKTEQTNHRPFRSGSPTSAADRFRRATLLRANS